MDTNALLNAPIFSSAASEVKPASIRGRFGSMSLRAQGFVLLLLGVLLVVAYGLFLLSQKEKLQDTFATLNAKEQLEGRFYRLSADLGRLDREFDDSTASQTPRAKLPFLQLRLKAILNDSQELLADNPELVSKCDKLSQDFEMLGNDSSIEKLRATGIQMHNTSDEVDKIITNISADRQKLSEGWLKSNMGVAISSALASLIALVGFGSFGMFFFTRLTTDVRKLATSARAIALGNPHQQIAVTRSDEIGELMESMNWMANQLVKREKQLVIARQQYFHAEKMVAINSLAAGVAHEIGNPLEAISAVAQSIVGAKDNACQNRGQHCHPEIILEQIARVANITRDLANFSGPCQLDMKLQGLNELIRNTCRFMRYDHRYRHIELVVNLDPQLPALLIVSDQFTQIFMNLLINAADAFGSPPKASSRVVITTRLLESSIIVKVEDNGSGMDDATVQHAFDPFFTTKSDKQGSGLGLAVCKSIIDAYGGTITLESRLGIGTEVKIILPLDCCGTAPNGHSQCAALNNETGGARFPLSSSLPQAGERDKVSLREFHVK